MNLAMNARKHVIAILATLLVFFTGLGVAQAEDGTIELKVLHTNDIHAKINDFGKMAAYIKAERAASEYSLYLDAGDIFSGNPVVDLQYGYPIIDLLNNIGVDAMAIGNHEFDYGQEETVKRMNQSNFPWLSANTIVTSDTLVDFPQPDGHTILDVNGLSVGIFSLTEAPPGTGPLNVVGLNFADPIETAKEYEFLEDETDIQIALTHIGYPEDQKLAQEVDFIDVIIGGHSHTELPEPVVVNGTPIAQTGSDAKNVGNLKIEYDPNSDEVVSVEGFLQPVAEITNEPNPQIQAKVDQYNEEMNELLDEVIGETTTGLERTDYYSQDAPLGNFWTDAMRHHTGADIAFTNNGGMRADIVPGEVTAGDIYTVEPFENEIMTIEMTGAALEDVVEYSYSRRDQVDLQTSGLHYTILTDEKGAYVDAEIEVHGVPLQADAKYVVAISDFFGSGGSGYNFVGDVIEPLTGKMTESMINYAKYLTNEGKTIDYEHEGRVAVEVMSEDNEEEEKEQDEEVDEDREGEHDEKKDNEEEVEQDDEKDETPELKETVTAETTVAEGKVSVDDASIAELQDKGTLIIELPTEADVVEVHFSNNQLQTLVEKEAVIEIVQLDEVTLAFHATTFSDQNELTVRLERVDMENPLSAVYDFTILDNETVISSFNDNVTLTFTVQEDAVDNPENVKLYNLNEDGVWVSVESVYENGLVTGSTDHFSIFTVLEGIIVPEEEGSGGIDEDLEEPTTETDDENTRTEETSNHEETVIAETTNDGGGTESGGILPSTATSMFNWIAAGIVFMIAGTIGVIIYRRRLVVDKN